MISMNEPVNATTALGSTLASLLASIGAVFAASCCVLPLAFSVAGIGSVSLAWLTELAPYRTFFLAASASALAVAWGTVLWRRAICRLGGACIAPRRPAQSFDVATRRRGRVELTRASHQ